MFDGFKLIVSCKNEDLPYYASDNVIVTNGEFTTVFYPGKLGLFEKGSYQLTINSGMPQIQEIEVLKKTGLEYEKITGDLVKHRGNSSTIKYTTVLDLDPF